MPKFSFTKNPESSGAGWNNALLRKAKDLVLSAGLDIRPETMSHTEFCDLWAKYRLEQLKEG